MKPMIAPPSTTATMIPISVQVEMFDMILHPLANTSFELPAQNDPQQTGSPFLPRGKLLTKTFGEPLQRVEGWGLHFFPVPCGGHASPTLCTGIEFTKTFPDP